MRFDSNNKDHQTAEEGHTVTLEIITPKKEKIMTQYFSYLLSLFNSLLRKIYEISSVAIVDNVCFCWN